MRGKQNKKMVSLAAGLLLAALTLGMKASAEPQWLPTAASHRAAERGELCSVLRALQDDNRKMTVEHTTVLQEQIKKIKTQRQLLEACAKTKGIAPNGGDLAESAMAEFCGPQFAVWIHQGYQLEMVRQDLAQATKDLTVVTAKVSTDCGPKRVVTQAQKPSDESTEGETREPLALAKKPSLRDEMPVRRRKEPIHTAWLRGNELPQ